MTTKTLLTVTTSLLTLCSMLASAPALAAEPVLFGDAVSNAGRTTLTPDMLGSSGAMFSGDAASAAASFSISAELYFGTKDGTGADGIAVVLSEAPLLGAGGGGLGHWVENPTQRSMIVEFDTYHNAILGDPVGDHVAILENQAMDHNSASDLSGTETVANLEDGQDHCASVIYDAPTQQLCVALDGEPLNLSVAKDLAGHFAPTNGAFYWGFSAGTGGASNLHQVSGEQLVTTAMDMCQMPGLSETHRFDSNLGGTIEIDGNGDAILGQTGTNIEVVAGLTGTPGTVSFRVAGTNDYLRWVWDGSSYWADVVAQTNDASPDFADDATFVLEAGRSNSALDCDFSGISIRHHQWAGYYFNSHQGKLVFTSDMAHNPDLDKSTFRIQ